jgi:histone-lysine N-methyltransferase SETMAR
MQWMHLLSLVAKKFQMRLSAGKLRLTIFWDSQGPILETYPEQGTTVSSAIDCDMLLRGLKPAIRSKRRRRLSEGDLLHDNARPHTVACTLETLRKFKWEVMEHPAHSPDLALTDFHLFGLLKEALGGRRLRTQCISGYLSNRRICRAVL